jgi:hypothetical protein
MRQAGSHVGSHVGIDKIAATFKQWGRLIKADYIAKNKENAAKVLGEPVQVLLKELQSQSSELHKLRTTFSNLNLEKLYSAVGEVYRDMGWQQVQLGILLQHLEGWTDTAETVALTYGNTEYLKRKIDSYEGHFVTMSKNHKVMVDNQTLMIQQISNLTNIVMNPGHRVGFQAPPYHQMHSFQAPPFQHFNNYANLTAAGQPSSASITVIDPTPAAASASLVRSPQRGTAGFSNFATSPRQTIIYRAKSFSTAQDCVPRRPASNLYECLMERLIDSRVYELRDSIKKIVGYENTSHSFLKNKLDDIEALVDRALVEAATAFEVEAMDCRSNACVRTHSKVLELKAGLINQLKIHDEMLRNYQHGVPKADDARYFESTAEPFNIIHAVQKSTMDWKSEAYDYDDIVRAQTPGTAAAQNDAGGTQFQRVFTGTIARPTTPDAAETVDLTQSPECSQATKMASKDIAATGGAAPYATSRAAAPSNAGTLIAAQSQPKNVATQQSAFVRGPEQGKMTSYFQDKNTVPKAAATSGSSAAVPAKSSLPKNLLSMLANKRENVFQNGYLALVAHEFLTKIFLNNVNMSCTTWTAPCIKRCPRDKAVRAYEFLMKIAQRNAKENVCFFDKSTRVKEDAEGFDDYRRCFIERSKIIQTEANAELIVLLGEKNITRNMKTPKALSVTGIYHTLYKISETVSDGGRKETVKDIIQRMK